MQNRENFRNDDLASLLSDANSNISASLPHHLKLNHLNHFLSTSPEIKIIIIVIQQCSPAKNHKINHLGEMASDWSTHAWFFSKGVILDLGVPLNRQNLRVLQDIFSKTKFCPSNVVL